MQAEGSHVLKLGAADFKTYGDFFALGTKVGFDVAAPVGGDAGVIASLSYRYLPTLSGPEPNIGRFDATLKYRFWLDDGLGVDLGLTYGRGRESKTYKYEDKLDVGVGVLF